MEPLLCFPREVLNARALGVKLVALFPAHQQQKASLDLHRLAGQVQMSPGDGRVTPWFHLKLDQRLMPVLPAPETG